MIFVQQHAYAADLHVNTIGRYLHTYLPRIPTPRSITKQPLAADKYLEHSEAAAAAKSIQQQQLAVQYLVASLIAWV